MELKLNQWFHGFRYIDEREIPEINSVGRLFLHEKSGARLLFLENEEENKVFAITFRTPPMDSTGLPHILEHSVLCGSRKYPVKEPFVELAKGSLNTFLNAFTFSDKTMYPVASKNDKDFRNLMDVYLDAVFYPNIYKDKEILMQEGWHYELENKEDEITYKGVVYNEMKGAFSAPESILFRKIQESLFPDTPYGLESGGDPEVIPQLTQEQFEAFHRKYYHPSNSYIFLYGKMDILEHLRYLDEEYLSHFRRIEVDSRIPEQKPFASQRELVIEYPITPNEKEEDKTFFSLNFAVGRSTDPEIYLAFEILEHILLDTPASPLKKALIEADLGKDVFGVYDNSILQPTFSVVVKNSNIEQKERFQQVVFDTLAKLVREGIDKQLIEASINRKEFALREADMRNYPRGLIYGITVMDSWLHDEDPFMHLQYEGVLTNIKSALSSNYFEQLIETYLLNNTHRSLLVVKPKKGLAEAKAEELKKKLSEFKAKCSEEELERIMAQTKKLKEKQNRPDTPEDLAKLPLLALHDIGREAEILPLVVKEEQGIKVLHHPMFTNKITYLNLYVDTRTIDQELLPYVALIAGILGKVSTARYHYEDLSNQVNIHTGGIGFSAEVFSDKDSDQEIYPKLMIKAKALTDKMEKLIELLGEIIGASRFDEKKRIKEIIDELKSRLEMSIFDRGHLVAANRALSYFSPVGKLNEIFKGLSFYKFVAELSKNFDAQFSEISSNLQRVSKLLFHRDQCLVSVTSDETDYPVFQRCFPNLAEQLGTSNQEMNTYRFTSTPENEGLMTSGKVQYVAKANNFKRLGYAYSGKMLVLRTIISLDYLWNRVRVQGGAYGGFGNVDRNGNLYFASYRDPNLKETLQVYDGVAEYLRNFEADDRQMTKYIIGTISRLDAPLTPSMKGERAAAHYISGLTKADIQREREEVLSTTQEDIREFSNMVADLMKENYYCVLGNEEKIRENESLFHQLVHVFE